MTLPRAGNTATNDTGPVEIWESSVDDVPMQDWSQQLAARTTTYRLAPEAKHIDLATTYHDTRTTVITRGLYHLRGDALEYCISGPGGPRPHNLGSRLGDGWTYVLLRRVPHSQ